MGFKEKFEQMDKAKAAVVALLAVTVVTTSMTAYQTSKIKQLLVNNAIAPMAQAAPQPAEAQAEPAPTKKPSEYKFGVAYEKAIQQSKPMALLFYADWCHFCVGFMPIYEKMYKKYKHKYNFVKINVEDEKYKALVEKYKIEGFPTLFLVRPSDFENRIHVPNRDFGDDNTMHKTFDEFLK